MDQTWTKHQTLRHCFFFSVLLFSLSLGLVLVLRLSGLDEVLVSLGAVLTTTLHLFSLCRHAAMRDKELTVLFLNASYSNKHPLWPFAAAWPHWAAVDKLAKHWRPFGCWSCSCRAAWFLRLRSSDSEQKQCSPSLEFQLLTNSSFKAGWPAEHVLHSRPVCSEDLKASYDADAHSIGHSNEKVLLSFFCLKERMLTQCNL